MVRRKLFLQWSLLMILVLIGAVISQRLGWFAVMYESDFTKLTVITLVVFGLASLWCGRLTWRLEEAIEQRPNKAFNTKARLTDIEIQAERGWYAATLCTGLGLLGTVWGIFTVFYSGFTGFLSGDAKAIQELLARLSSGMATAAVTTIVGLVCAIIINQQYHMLALALETEKAREEP